MYVFIYVCMHVRKYVYMFVLMYVCMHLRRSARKYIGRCDHVSLESNLMYHFFLRLNGDKICHLVIVNECRVKSSNNYSRHQKLSSVSEIICTNIPKKTNITLVINFFTIFG